MSARYSEGDVPYLHGKRCLVTGANTGIGYHTARVLAARGATVWLGCRSEERADAAIRTLADEIGEARLQFLRLDLGDLASIEGAAQRVIAEGPLDLLINNAGIMSIGKHGRTNDGFEAQFGINHLGHFALTGHLLPHMRDRSGARIVTVASLAHQGASIDFDDLNAERHFSAFHSYRMSKLANLLFSFELHRRLKEHRAAVLSIACHPGSSATEIFRDMPGPVVAMAGPAMRALLNSAQDGALPSLMAGTHEAMAGGEYIGPIGAFGIKTSAMVTRADEAAYDREAAIRLWQASIEMTGVDPGI